CDRCVNLIHEAEIEAEIGSTSGAWKRIVTLVGGEDGLKIVLILLSPRSNFIRLSEAGTTEILTQHRRVIALNASSGFVAAHTNPIHGLVIGDRLAQPHLERLADEGKAGHGDHDAACLKVRGDPVGSETLTAATGHDELPAPR